MNFKILSFGQRTDLLLCKKGIRRILTAYAFSFLFRGGISNVYAYILTPIHPRFVTLFLFFAVSPLPAIH